MSIRFSARTGWNLSENALATKAGRIRASGRAIVDLSESNPTRVGFSEPGRLIALLANPDAAHYRPEPLGSKGAREAICRDAARSGKALSRERLVLSASTSEAHAWLFKLLCDPGDEVLIPAPSYPLFSYLADVEAVRPVPYPLLRDEAFRIDLGAVERAITERTRAVVLVHPNNPTGTLTRRDDARSLDALAARHGLAIISDEVFGDYSWGPIASHKLPSFAFEGEALTFVLSGLSKVVCAPQLKLGWTSVHGPEAEVTAAVRRLEIIADTFLSVSTPVQVALPLILERKEAIQAEVKTRIRENLAALDSSIALLGPEAPVRRLQADGGWSVILEVPRTETDDRWIDRLLDEHGILVQPGYFFDMDRDGFLVASLLPEPRAFAEAMGHLVALVST